MTRILLGLSCAGAVTACQKNNLPSKGRPIKVRVETVDTKGKAMDLTGLKAEGHFVLDAFLDKEAYDFTKDPKEEVDQEYIVSGGKYNVFFGSSDWYIKDTNGKESYTWIANDVTRFWCYWPEDSEVDAASEGIREITTAPTIGSKSMKFSYTLPTSVAGSDATIQKDLLFAYSERTYVDENDTDGDNITISFNHPLSEVCFCVSPDDATFDVSLSIQRIAVKGVKNSGSCVFDCEGSIQPETGGKAMFTWTPGTTTADYSQDYDVSFGSKPSGWNSGTYTSTGGTFHLYSSTNSFMMIPQALGTGAELEVTFGNTGTGDPVTKTWSLNGDTWKAGHYYKYKIGATTIGRDISMIVILDEWGNFEDQLIVKP